MAGSTAKTPAPRNWQLTYWTYTFEDDRGSIIWRVVVFQHPSVSGQPMDLLHFLNSNYTAANQAAADLLAASLARTDLGKVYNGGAYGVLRCDWEWKGYWHPAYSYAS